MDAIFSNKLYQSSKYKDRINAALNDPMNHELVQQLKTYISKKDQKFLDPQESSTPEEVERPVVTEDVDEPADENKSVGTPASAPRHPSATNEFVEHETEAEFEPVDNETSEPSEAPKAESEEVAESTKVSKASVTASEQIKDLSEDYILTLLNGSENAFGVRRVSFVDSEIWIYYLDTTNLNNVMEDAISVITNKFKYVEFSRLARSYNAIVFTIGESK